MSTAIQDTPATEQVFGSLEVARCAGVTLRQIQWYDEREIVSPAQTNHKRLYSFSQVFHIVLITKLGSKEFTLQPANTVVVALRAANGLDYFETLRKVAKPPQFMLVECDCEPRVFSSKPALLEAIFHATSPLVVVDLTAEAKRLAEALGM